MIVRFIKQTREIRQASKCVACAPGSCVWGELQDWGFFTPAWGRRCQCCGRVRYIEPKGAL